jgi:hypothetical protein
MSWLALNLPGDWLLLILQKAVCHTRVQNLPWPLFFKEGNFPGCANFPFIKRWIKGDFRS